MSEEDKPGKWWFEVGNGNRVSKAVSRGKVVYTAWRRTEADNPRSRVRYRAVLYTASLEEAKRACEVAETPPGYPE